VTADDALPLTPYAGTSGWSGTDTSRDRAAREDTDGTTSHRQRATLTALRDVGRDGYTWRELAATLGWHHGQASGALSTLHKEGRIVRLTEKRDRCRVYVHPAHQDGRDADTYQPRPSAVATQEDAVAVVRDALLAALEALDNTQESA